MSRGPAPEPLAAAQPVRPLQRDRLDVARRALAARHGVPVSRIRGRTVPELEHHAQQLARAMRNHPAGTGRNPDDGPTAA